MLPVNLDTERASYAVLTKDKYTVVRQMWHLSVNGVNSYDGFSLHIDRDSLDNFVESVVNQRELEVDPPRQYTTEWRSNDTTDVPFELFMQIKNAPLGLRFNADHIVCE